MDPVVHFEMPYENRQRAADFYSKTFGWQAQMLGAEMGEYMVVHTGETDSEGMIQKPGVINGGFYKKPTDSTGQAPSVVIAVTDIDESIKKIEASGGKIMGEATKIPGVGIHASFIDTEGNRVSILQPVAMNG